MDDPEYSFRDADRAILRIFTYLKDQKESKGMLPAEAESVIQILEGFLTSREQETAQTNILNPKTKPNLSTFELEIPTEEFDPRKLFRGNK